VEFPLKLIPARSYGLGRHNQILTMTRKFGRDHRSSVFPGRREYLSLFVLFSKVRSVKQKALLKTRRLEPSGGATYSRISSCLICTVAATIFTHALEARKGCANAAHRTLN
jgi:hypothetical protein